MTNHYRALDDTANRVPTDDSALARAAELKNRYYSLLYTEMAERRRAEASLRLSNQLLTALSRAQAQFVAGTDLNTIFHDLLAALLATTGSSHGLLRITTAVLDQADGLTVSWTAASAATTTPLVPEHLEAVVEQVLAAQDAVFAALQPDPRVSAPSLEPFCYVGLPIACGEAAEAAEGVLVLARTSGEYTADDVALLEPLLTTCTQLLIAQRHEEQRHAAEVALYEERALLAQRVEQRTAELRLSNAELARAARAKDEFLATVNHELRTPLNAVLLYAESLAAQITGPLNPRQLRAATGIQESAEHLLTLINDILDVAKIDAGKLDLQIASISVESVCQSTLRLITEQACKKSIKVTYTRDPEVTMMDVDERRLKQILVNLLGNAVKFTPEGGAVGLEVHGDPARNAVRFLIWDTGIGIAPEDLPKLFQPFMQLDNGHARQHSGTGLGLVLVYRMAEMHLGGVTVESTLGEGSRFTITLPWQRQPHADRDGAFLVCWPSTKSVPHAQRDANAHNGSDPDRGPFLANPGELYLGQSPLVLLAEDNEASIDALSIIILHHGCRLIVARTGREAVREAKAQHPDLILMDVQMPELDGLAATRTIRVAPESEDIPIVALTALAMPGDRERCLEAGASHYLTKPIQPQHLLALIDQLANKSSPTNAQVTAASHEVAETI